MKYTKIRDVKSPSRGTPESAGIDFYVPNDFNGGETLVLKPGERTLIPSGLKVKLPSGYALIAFNKSGVASKKGLIVGACVVDEDYQGEVHLNMINTNQEGEFYENGMYVKYTGTVEIKAGDKLTQFIILPVNYANPEEIEDLNNLYEMETSRGEGGFGSTGN